MMVSTRGRYALRILVDLAENQRDGYVTLREIAERQEISEKYMESIVKDLVRAGVLEGLRGKGGGYRLTRKPEEYTVGQILRAAEGSLAPVGCLDCTRGRICPIVDTCSVIPVWRELGKVTSD